MTRSSRNRPPTALLLLLAPGFFAPGLPAATGTHLPSSTLYPRLIRLQHAPPALIHSILAKTGNRLFRSLDEGRTFTFLATVPTVSLEPGNPTPAKDARDKERCCSTLYELPQKLGRFKAGTLLYSASFFSGGTPAIEIFTSSDEGAHWRYLSTPMKAGDEHHGLWEPAFSTAKDGSLVMFVSDETDPCCSQKLVQMRTTNLRTWSSKRDTVTRASQASGSPGDAGSPGAAKGPDAHGSRDEDRPGMAIVSLLPDGAYFMSYEVCGPTAHCQVYTRTLRRRRRLRRSAQLRHARRHHRRPIPGPRSPQHL